MQCLDTFHLACSCKHSTLCRRPHTISICMPSAMMYFILCVMQRRKQYKNKKTHSEKCQHAAFMIWVCMTVCTIILTFHHFSKCERASKIDELMASSESANRCRCQHRTHQSVWHCTSGNRRRIQMIVARHLKLS